MPRRERAPRLEPLKMHLPFTKGHRKVEQSWRPKILGKSAFCFAIIMPLIHQNNGSQVLFWSNTKFEALFWYRASTWLLRSMALRTLTGKSSSVVQMDEQVLFFFWFSFWRQTLSSKSRHFSFDSFHLDPMEFLGNASPMMMWILVCRVPKNYALTLSWRITKEFL